MAAAIRDDTLLVTVMLANNEIGVLQPIAEIGEICQQRGILLHTDATQAVGRVPVDVATIARESDELLRAQALRSQGNWCTLHSSAVASLAVGPPGGRRRPGGGLRSGTLNVPAIAAFGEAVRLCQLRQPDEAERIAGLRDRLFTELAAKCQDDQAQRSRAIQA